MESRIGYLCMVGDSLSFRWSTEIPKDAVAKVTPAASVRSWELKGAALEIHRNANTNAHLFEGFSNFLRHARKKGTDVTLLQPLLKIALYRENQVSSPVAFVETG